MDVADGPADPAGAVLDCAREGGGAVAHAEDEETERFSRHRLVTAFSPGRVSGLIFLPAAEIGDEGGEASLAGRFLPGAHHPPDRGLAIGGRARLELGPGWLVRPELLLIAGIERDVAVLVGIALLLGQVARRERLGAGGMHPAELLQFADPLDVDRAPDAPLPSRREADRPGELAAAAAAVDPAVSERLIQGFLIGHARLARRFLVEADEKLAGRLVVLVEPRAPVGRRFEEGRPGHRSLPSRSTLSTSSVPIDR